MKKLSSWFLQKTPSQTDSVDKRKVGLALLVPAILLTTIIPSVMGTKSFDTLYTRHMTAEVDRIEHMADAIGFFPKKQTEGTMNIALDIPVLMSGKLGFEYLTQIHERDATLELKNLLLDFKSMVSTGSLALDSFTFTSHKGDSYFLYDGLKDNGFFPEEVKKTMTDFSDKWLSWTHADVMRSLTGASLEEKIPLTIMRNLSLMNFDDMRTYLTDYPLFRETKDLGMTGSMHLWEVELDKENVVDLMKKLSQDFADTPLTPEAEQSLKQNLAGLTLTGTLAFDPSSPLEATFDLALSDATQKNIALLKSSSTKTSQSLTLISPQENTEIHFDAGATPKAYTASAYLKQEGIERARAEITVIPDGSLVKLDITAEGVTASVENKKDEKGNFDGRMTLPVGALTWTGQYIESTLKGLSVNGVIPDGTLRMALTESGGMLAGPLSLLSAGEEVLRAHVGLQKEKGKFFLKMDVPTTDNQVGASLELSTTYKTSPFGGTISPPSNTVPMDTFFTEMEKTLPKDAFVQEEIPDGATQTGISIQ